MAGRILSKIEKLENKYNAEHDVLDGDQGPNFNYIDAELLNLIELLALENQSLVARIERLEKGEG